ncbi:apoptosis-associated speck-like protein containing a CARD [Cololabis saira]|uniref:apoptosis-associated speck-like protein containing a CARD n=1 Tax=Cololabis saira TaxID=129043 RepID=UPI002AD1E4DD|nr:apoptosis-associated speck-like protein containing a CARD [Cololabis saira]
MDQKKILKESLMNLSKENFNEFRDALWSRKEKPRILRAKVEGKIPLDVADVMITTFGEQRALEVAVEILRYINCNQDADELAKEAGAAGPAGPGGPAGPAGLPMKHFVDKHRTDLVQRVSNIDPILDALLSEKVIRDEMYTKIIALPTSYEKMRELYVGPLRSSDACKDIFLKILRDQEPFLLADLERNSLW